MVLVVLLIALIVLGMSAFDRAAAPTDRGRATLTIMDMQPLAVSGRGFKARERVVVSTGSARGTVTASTAGRFIVRFARLRCAGAIIRAVGSKGSRATTRPPRTLCIEP